MEKVVKLKYELLIIRLRRLFLDFVFKKRATYLAGYMEADMEHCQGWRNKFTQVMANTSLHIDDPTKNEAEKLGMPVEESREKLYGLKRSGRRDEFLDIIDRIFSVDLKQVANSSFLVVYWRSDIKTVGTIGEMQLATLLGIPIYCITPDKISELNSWLLGMILINDGEIFRTPNECAKYIIQKYYAKKDSINIGAVLVKPKENDYGRPENTDTV
jgi:hypothetical protein